MSHTTVFICFLIFIIAHFLHPVTSSTPPSSPAANNNLIIVKLGGSCVTNKSAFEELNEGNLEKFCEQMASVSSNTVSRHIIVHGAGSFGHFSARQYELVKGGRDKDWRQGFCETRTSVLKLNTFIVSALTKYKYPGTAVTLFPSARTKNRVLDKAGPLSMCQSILENHITPVIHGDAILDISHRCTIFSGDKIMAWLALHMKPKMAVFLTDVAGIHDKPPTEDGAELIHEIWVEEDGSISTTNVETSIAKHDVTGGIKGKLDSAIDIAKMGVPVIICELGTEHSLQALGGEFPSVCTLIRRR